jgi:hypothetical protein
MNNQLLLGLQIAWIGHVIVEGNIADKANEDNVEYSFLLVPIMNFIVMEKILLPTFLVIDIPEIFLSKAQTTIDPLYGIKMPWQCGHE